MKKNFDINENLILQGKGYYIVSGGASASQTTAHIKSAIRRKNFKVNLTDLTDKVGILSVQGPYRLVIYFTNNEIKIQFS